jgi:hypothetical protein
LGLLAFAASLGVGLLIGLERERNPVPSSQRRSGTANDGRMYQAKRAGGNRYVL